MRYVCEFTGEDDSLIIRDIANDLDELEESLISGIEILGPLIRCYPLSDEETSCNFE